MKVPGPLSVVIFVSLLVGCSPEPPQQSRIYSMGTWVDVSIRGVPAVTVEAALDEIQTLLSSFERDYYAWAPGQLAVLNASIANGESARVSEELAALLREAQRLSALSGRTFEPGLGALVELWGFQSPVAARSSPPRQGEIDERLAAAAVSALSIDGSTVTSEARELLLDLGGIAKGAAVDAIVVALLSNGVEHALINAGGDLRVIGQAGDADGVRPWRVGIRHPRGPGLLGSLELDSNEAAFTSGDYERFFEVDGTRLHHILDPSTGYPVDHTQAVTVIANNGTLADAAATAIFVAGPERWRDTAQALGIDSVLRVDTDGSLELTSSMQRRLTPASEADSDIITPAGQDEPD
ncbi:MAG: FAD:protein FMN transferase [Gammaproteobacteria bacterium]